MNLIIPMCTIFFPPKMCLPVALNLAMAYAYSPATPLSLHLSSVGDRTESNGSQTDEIYSPISASSAYSRGTESDMDAWSNGTPISTWQKVTQTRVYSINTNPRVTPNVNTPAEQRVQMKLRMLEAKECLQGDQDENVETPVAKKRSSMAKGKGSDKPGSKKASRKRGYTPQHVNQTPVSSIMEHIPNFYLDLDDIEMLSEEEDSEE